MRLTLPLTLLALTCAPALAHDLARDRAVQAVMYTDPDDAPLIAKPTAAYFELTTAGKTPIPLSHCQCSLNVYTGMYKAGSPALLTGKLTQGPRRLQSRLVFPHAGAYTMVLTGRPKPGFQFQPFTLSWPVRVDTP